MKNKKKLLIFINIFILSIVFTYSSIATSHALDSYCTMCNGYKNTAIWFLQNGRVFSFIFYMFFNSINLPYDLLRPISIITSNIILSLNTLILYNEIIGNLNLKNILFKISIIILFFLLYYSPLYPSILVLDEAFIINLGILFLTISSTFILKNKLKNYLLSLLFAIIGITCYQGIASYLFIHFFILILSNKEYRNNIKYYLKKFILIISIYGIAFITNLFIIKLVSIFTNKNISKLGSFNILKNLENIINTLIPKSFKYLFGYTNYKYYYMLVIITLVITIIYIIKNKDKVNNIILLSLLVLCSSFFPFIPNLFMNSNVNYIEARMALTIGIIPVIILIYNYLSFKIDNKVFYLLSFVICFILLISFYSINQNMKIDLRRYQNDTEYLNNISKNIAIYEKENLIYIDTIYYVHDKNVDYYYHFGNANDTNIRLMAIDWALECAISNQLKRKINFQKMSDEKQNELFSNLEYDNFDDRQMFFDNNILYLLVY